MTYILILISIICNALMDAINSRDTFAKYGLFFSREGWKCKYLIVEWFNNFLPLEISRFIGETVLVVFSDFWHLLKTIMILSFMCAIFGFTWWAVIMYFAWGLFFSGFYYLVR